MPLLTEQELLALTQRADQETQVRNLAIGVRRALLFRDPSAASASALGLHVPEPYNKSHLIIRFMSAISDAAQNIVAALITNPPTIQVNRTPRGTERQSLAWAGDEEGALNATYWLVTRGRRLQEQIAWAQTVEGAGWYHSLPVEAAFGHPSRRYFTEWSDAEADAGVREARAVWSWDVGDGKRKPAEPADHWAQRRQEASKQRALDGRGLFSIETFPNRLVWTQRDAGGISRALVTEDITADQLGAGSVLAGAYAATTGDERFRALGLQFLPNGEVSVGVPPGVGRGDSTVGAAPRVRFSRYFDRDWMAYFVSGWSVGGAGAVLWSQRHTLGHVPLYAAPAFTTGEVDLSRQYMALLDGEFAFTPIINQLVTLLSNIVTYNALPRWVVLRTDGTPLLDDATNEPKVIKYEEMLGMNPNQVAVLYGAKELRQLRIEDGDLLLRLLQYYAQREQPVLPSQFETGAGGAAGPAWQTLLMQRAGAKQYQPAVQTNAEAVGQMAMMWANEMRKIPSRIFFLSVPKRRADGASMRGFIEVDTRTLTDDLQVRQSSSRLDEKITLQQMGLTLRREGAIDDIQMYDKYFEEDDPEEAEMRKYVQNMSDAVLLGPNEQIPPGSLLYEVAQGIRGEVTTLLLQESPAFARQFAEIAPITPPGQEGTDSFNRGLGGPLNMQAGVRQPGMGMGVTPSRLPPLQVPGAAPPPPQVVR